MTFSRWFPQTSLGKATDRTKQCGSMTMFILTRWLGTDRFHAQGHSARATMRDGLQCATACEELVLSRGPCHRTSRPGMCGNRRSGPTMRLTPCELVERPCTNCSVIGPCRPRGLRAATMGMLEVCSIGLAGAWSASGPSPHQVLGGQFPTLGIGLSASCLDTLLARRVRDAGSRRLECLGDENHASGLERYDRAGAAA